MNSRRQAEKETMPNDFQSQLLALETDFHWLRKLLTTKKQCEQSQRLNAELKRLMEGR